MGFEDEDAVYYRMREQQERDLAKKVAGREVCHIHQTLAEKYHSLAEMAEGRAARGIENVAVQGTLLSPSI